MIKEIAAEETFAIRGLVLRPGRSLQECSFNEDKAPGTFHLGCFKDKQLIGVATYIPSKNALFEHSFQYQLRGMAVLPSFRGRNAGHELLQAGESRLLQIQKDVFLWCNAREVAIPFYQKHGYQQTGALFMIPNICMHVLMLKTLSQT